MSNPIKYAPLSSGFMAVSILGFLFSIWFLFDKSPPWGFTVATVCVIMFFASVISMTKAEPIPEHMDSLAMHELLKVQKKHLLEKKQKKLP